MCDFSLHGMSSGRVGRTNRSTKMLSLMSEWSRLLGRGIPHARPILHGGQQ